MFAIVEFLNEPDNLELITTHGASVIIVGMFLEFMRRNNKHLTRALDENTKILGKVLHALDRK